MGFSPNKQKEKSFEILRGRLADCGWWEGRTTYLCSTQEIFDPSVKRSKSVLLGPPRKRRVCPHERDARRLRKVVEWQGKGALAVNDSMDDHFFHLSTRGGRIWLKLQGKEEIQQALFGGKKGQSRGLGGKPIASQSLRSSVLQTVNKRKKSLKKKGGGDIGKGTERQGTVPDSLEEGGIGVCREFSFKATGGKKVAKKSA